MTADTGLPVADLVCRARDSRASIRAQHAAFAILVERFEEMAFTTALRACDDPESARDACQEAFLVAWRGLPALREPAAFGGWLKRLVRTQCARARRRRDASADLLERARDATEVPDSTGDIAGLFSRREVQGLVRRAVLGLPPAERDAVILFYFLGESLRATARALEVSVGHAGKRVYTARLRLRRCLPRSVTETFLVAASPAFARRVRAGGLDEFAGEYRFATRPGQPVIIRREGDVLASYAAGQRNVLASRRPDTLAATEYDGAARFQRNRRGRVSGFVYYEFGRRLGVARRVVKGRKSDPAPSTTHTSRS